MQNIINSRPKKILFGRKIRITCQCLVKINQPKSQIKETYERLFAGPENNQTETAEEDMEDIVRRRSAGETMLRRDEKTSNARQN